MVSTLSRHPHRLGRLASLMARKAQLEAQLQSEISHPAPDYWMLQALKKQKLRIKEEIFALGGQMAHHAPANSMMQAAE